LMAGQGTKATRCPGKYGTILRDDIVPTSARSATPRTCARFRARKRLTSCGGWSGAGDYASAASGAARIMNQRNEQARSPDERVHSYEQLFTCHSQPSITEALGEEVDVNLVQAIGRGDECCEFLVHPRPRRSPA
jgi:hypothetical protein